MFSSVIDVTPLLPRGGAPHTPVRTEMRTVAVAGSVLAQGDYVRDLPDGRILINDGSGEIAGRPLSRVARVFGALLLAVGLGIGVPASQATEPEVTRLS